MVRSKVSVKCPLCGEGSFATIELIFEKIGIVESMNADDEISCLYEANDRCQQYCSKCQYYFDWECKSTLVVNGSISEAIEGQNLDGDF
jgi:hypothetical protein